MSTSKSTRAPKIDPALRIPLTVLAAIPEKLRTLGQKTPKLPETLAPPHPETAQQAAE